MRPSAQLFVAVAIALLPMPARAANTGSISAMIDLKGETGRTVSIGQPDQAAPFTFDRVELKFSVPAGKIDINTALFDKSTKPQDPEVGADFRIDAKITDSRSGRSEGNDASCQWTSAAKAEADCGFAEDGGPFKLIMRDSAPGARPLAALVFGGDDRSQITIAIFDDKVGVDGVTLKAKKDTKVVLPVAWIR